VDPAYEVAASSLRARSLQLEAVAHDLAHLSTTAYKGGRLSFAQTREAALVALEGTGTRQEQGALRATGRSLDVALQGNGFLVARTPAGDRVTRDGRLQLGTDGTLRSLEGSPMVGRDDQPLRVDPAGGEVAIAEDGTVRQGTRVRGQLALRAFANPEALPRAGALRFDATGAASAPLRGGLTQGALEQSAVDPAAALVEMIRLNRLYELSLKAASTLTNDLDARALSDVASTR